MGSEKTRTLGDVVTLVRGTTYKGALLGQPGPVLLGLASIQRNGGFRSDSLKTYGGESKPKLLLRPGDLYVSLKDVTQSADLLGAIARVPEEIELGRLTQDTVKLEFLDDSYPPEAVYWALRTPHYRSHCRGHATGTTNLGLPREDFLAYPLPQPSDELLSFVEMLEAIERRITLLRRTNATLEAIAQAVFKSWFVDFDPVRARAEGREPEGMDAATAAQFPCEFEDSELGPIPKGWNVSALEQHIDAERGLSYKGAGLASAGEGLPMHNLNSVLEGAGYKYAGIKYYSGAYKDRHLALAGDIIVANTEQGHHHRLIGFPAIVPQRYPSGVFSHHLYRVRAKPGSPLAREWIYWCLRTTGVRDQIIGCANGSTVNMLKPAGLKIPKFVAPPLGLSSTFAEIAATFRLRQEVNVESAELLGELRDTILPRLIYGKLSLPGAASEIERCISGAGRIPSTQGAA